MSAKAGWWLALALSALPVCARAAAPPASLPAPQQQASEPNLLVLQVTLQGDVLTEALTGYQIGNDVFLPIGELCRVLTIAVRSQPAAGRADGYVLSEQDEFHLDVLERTVSVNGRSAPLDRALVKLQADDVYVASRALTRWLPVDMELDLSALVLAVRPRATLPLEAGRARRAHAPHALAAPSAPSYPRHATPYRLIDTPFIDQTLRVGVNTSGHAHTASAGYTAYATGDLLGMDSALFVSSVKEHPSPQLRLTMGRTDPDGGLLGPLDARAVQFGSIAMPGSANVTASSSGNGVLVSNRPLNQPARFDTQLLQGDLPPGWDVELFYNDALLAFQQSRADGKYSFEVPLAYGRNELRLMFHGPLGQLRVERHSYLLEQSMVKRGEFLYFAGVQRDARHQVRALAEADYGISDKLTATAAVARAPAAGRDEQSYASAGLRGYWNAFIVNGELARSASGGHLAQVGVRTALGALSVAANHVRLDDFTSDVFRPQSDPVRSRDELALTGRIAAGSLPVLPVAFSFRRDTLASRARDLDASARISTFMAGSAVTSGVRWQSVGHTPTASGFVQATRRVAGIGVTGALQYDIRPDPGMSSLALSADKDLSGGYLLNLGATRSFRNSDYELNAALNKTLGSYGLGLAVSYSSNGSYSAGLQLFMASGQEPRRGQWMLDAQPMAGAGAASVLVFVDKNMNGVMDAGDEPVKNAGFIVNGGPDLARTNADGIAYLNRLTPRQHLDIAVDTQTLEDPQWVAAHKGWRIVPRPGKVSMLEFAVNVTGEIDGNTYVFAHGAKRALGNLQLELLDFNHRIVGSATSSADGYFLLSGVLPGKYLLRASPSQLQSLKLTDTGMQLLTMLPSGEFLNGRQVVMVPAEP